MKSRGIHLHASCRSDLISFDGLIDYKTKARLSESTRMLHPIHTRMLVQFPDKRLIQYDCGKLTLHKLLVQFRSCCYDVEYFRSTEENMWNFLRTEQL